MDAVLAYFNTQFILTGVGGGFLHALHERKVDPREVARYIVAGALLSNFVTPMVLTLVPSIPESAGGGIGFMLGYGVFRFCRFADRYLDQRMKPYEGPEHE